MAAPPGFTDALNRKYNIEQQATTDRGALLQAQAANITASTPFENALKAAQAYQTNETAKTVAPLATASQAATYAGVGETNARTGLYGAQTGLTGMQTQDLAADLGNIGLAGARYYRNQLRMIGALPGRGPVTTQNQRSIFDTNPAPAAPAPAAPAASTSLMNPAGSGQLLDDNYFSYGLAKGTTKVKSPGKAAGGHGAAGAPGAGPMASGGLDGALYAAMGASKVPGHGSGAVDKVKAVLAPGEAVVNKAGIKHIPGGRKTIAKANAKGAKEMGLSGHGKGKAAPPPQARGHFAAGTTSVPAPGQTVTSGSWSGPTGPSTPPPAPLPSSPTLGTDLRARLFGSK